MKRTNRFQKTEMVWRFADELTPRRYGMYIPNCPLNLVCLDMVTARFYSNIYVGGFEIDLVCQESFADPNMRRWILDRLGAMVMEDREHFCQMQGASQSLCKLMVSLSFNRIGRMNMCDVAMECFISVIKALGAQPIHHNDGLPVPKILQETFVDPNHYFSYGEHLAQKHYSRQSAAV